MTKRLTHNHPWEFKTICHASCLFHIWNLVDINSTFNICGIQRYQEFCHGDFHSHMAREYCHTSSTALHQSLSKYLTAQDTRGTPTLTEHNRALARLGNLLYVQPRSTIKVNCFFFFCPSYWANWSKTRYSSELVTKVFSFVFS